MSVALTPGARLFSTACATEAIVVKAPKDPVDLTIGGRAPVTNPAERGDAHGVVEGHGDGTQMGKRYTDEAETIEILCTKPGDGSIAIDGAALAVKGVKALPASD